MTLNLSFLKFAIYMHNIIYFHEEDLQTHIPLFSQCGMKFHDFMALLTLVFPHLRSIHSLGQGANPSFKKNVAQMLPPIMRTAPKQNVFIYYLTYIPIIAPYLIFSLTSIVYILSPFLWLYSIRPVYKFQHPHVLTLWLQANDLIFQSL